MRDLFPGYYRPTQAEFEKLWKECVFVFDANILLYLYRSSEATRKDFLNILTHLRDRIWLPHQAALEYQKNRTGEIDKLWRQYDTAVTNMLKQQKPALASDLSRHPLLEEQLDNLQGKIDKAYNQYMKKLKQLGKEIQALKQKHPNWGEKDTIRDQIDDLFNGRVGRPYPSTELNNIYSQGAVRYENEQPPGYKDTKTKQGIKIYGDLVLWFQIIAYGRENNSPIIFITDDRKEDWWQEKNGKTIGPRPELLQEYFDQTGQQIYLYQPKPFMEWAEKLLNLSSAPSSKEEIQAIGDADEKIAVALDVIKARQERENLPPNPYHLDYENSAYFLSDYRSPGQAYFANTITDIIGLRDNQALFDADIVGMKDNLALLNTIADISRLKDNQSLFNATIADIVGMKDNLALLNTIADIGRLKDNQALFNADIVGMKDNLALLNTIADIAPTLEPLTEELIAELVAKGWSEDELRQAALLGKSYNRSYDKIL